MDADYVIKSMEDFLKYMNSEMEKTFKEHGGYDPLYETYFKVEWKGKIMYVPFDATSVYSLTEIIEEELA